MIETPGAVPVEALSKRRVCEPNAHWMENSFLVRTYGIEFNQVLSLKKKIAILLCNVPL